MNTEIYIKKYGVAKLQNGRYAIAIDVDEVNKYAHVLLDLNYAKLDFALKKADGFIKSLHKNFIRNETTQIIFKFVNVGLITF